jgi:K+-sensing histidine kinase KdpD
MNLNVRLEDLDQAALLKTTRRLLAEADALSSRLAADKKVMGTTNFALKEANAYTTDDTRIGYMLSLQLSAAIRNAHTIEELRRAQDELKLSVEELDAYGHTIAHDLKSPLSSILFKRDLLLMRHRDRDEPSPKILAHLEAIGDNGQQMTRMIDQLLWLAKIRHTDTAIARFDHNLSDLGVEILWMRTCRLPWGIRNGWKRSSPI